MTIKEARDVFKLRDGEVVSKDGIESVLRWCKATLNRSHSLLDHEQLVREKEAAEVLFASVQ